MLLGLSGYARSGKDTVANYLVEKYGFTKVAFADSMREGLVALNPTILVDNLHVSLNQALSFYSWEELKTVSSDIRGLMQRFGTEMGRNLFGEDFWVEQTMRRVCQVTTPVVISDVRFHNEAYRIDKEFGAMWRIDRDGIGPANAHPSESDFLDWNCYQSTLTNNGSLEELYSKVDVALFNSNFRGGFLWPGSTN